MEAGVLSRSQIAHADGAHLAPEPDREARLIGWLCAGTGLALFAVMGVLGLLMRLTQADAIAISPEWFYRIMTLHGAGMLAGAMLAMMGALWFVVKSEAPLSLGRMLVSYGTIVAGAVVIVVAVMIGGFATGWTFLSPLPFLSAEQWSTWAAVAFFGGLTLVGIGFFVFCIDVLAAVTRAHGGFFGALGLGIFRGEEPPPPQVIGATAITTQGMLASAVGTTILFALLGRAIDSGVELNALWAKNLTYFFGHSFANLIIYLAASMVYVLLPRYAGRPWKTTKPIVLAWLATLLLVTTAYGHHLYMDFVQPEAAQVIGLVSSSAAAVPVAVVTIYTGLMLVWGSRYRWTLASVLLYLGFAGWAIGGVGAVIDSLIPVNVRYHNTLWVPAHFHTYLMMGVIMWLLAFLASMLERAAGRTASSLGTLLAPVAMVIGGYGLVAMWYASGALGVPRRYAIHSALFPGSEGYSVAASAFAIVFAVGFSIVLLEFVSLARDGLRRRRSTSAGSSAPPRIAGAGVAGAPPQRPPLASPRQIAIAVAAGVAASFVLLPDIVDASESSTQYHHLSHAAQFFVGAMIGAALGSTPAMFRRFAPRWSNVALGVVVLVPALTLLLMVPDVYRGFEDDDALHGAYHNLVVALGFGTGFSAALVGQVTGRLLLVLSVGMMLMFAAGVSGG